MQDEPEVPRVWLPFDDAPGLAMARAFGDFCLKEYGVISIPEFSHRLLTDRDEFIVIASDGVRNFNHIFATVMFRSSLNCQAHGLICNSYICIVVSCLGLCEGHQNCQLTWFKLLITYCGSFSA